MLSHSFHSFYLDNESAYGTNPIVDELVLLLEIRKFLPKSKNLGQHYLLEHPTDIGPSLANDRTTFVRMDLNTEV